MPWSNWNTNVQNNRNLLRGIKGKFKSDQYEHKTDLNYDFKEPVEDFDHSQTQFEKVERFTKLLIKLFVVGLFLFFILMGLFKQINSTFFTYVQP